MTIRSPAARADPGFTLIEVLVAFAIMAIALGTLFAVFGSGLRRGGQIEAERNALAVAQSVLADIGGEIPLADGKAEGEAPGGMRWRVDIQPYAVEAGQTQQSAPALPVRAHEVAVAVSWGGGAGQVVTLRTLRLAPTQPQQGS
jgi:general secretion pathway protein I